LVVKNQDAIIMKKGGFPKEEKIAIERKQVECIIKRAKKTVEITY